MQILIVCPCWPGIVEAYNEGKEPNGMPGFFHVIRELILQGNDVDLFIYSPREIILQKNRRDNDHWFSKVRVVGLLKLQQYDGIKRILYEIKIPLVMNHLIEPLLRKTNYDFIYGQGNYAAGVNRLARKHGIPFGLRKYGDDFAPLLKQNGIIISSIRSPMAAYSYLSSKSFMLGTNDGTEIDAIARRFRKKLPYDVYVWNNGFQACDAEDNKFESLCSESFIFQFSRFVSVKGQIDTVEAFYLSKQKGYPGKLIFGGTPDDVEYYNCVKHKIEKYGVQDHVHFLGKITAEQTAYLTHRSLVNMITGINYNLNNVFIETLGYGGIALVRNTPLIDKIIMHGVNGFIFDNAEECSDIIMDLYNGKYDNNSIRKQAMSTCITAFGTWKKRADREVDLITQIVSKQ